MTAHNITFALKPYVCWGSHLRFADPFQQILLTRIFVHLMYRTTGWRKRGGDVKELLYVL